MSKLLVIDQKARLSASQALKHPWVLGAATKADHLPNAIEKLKEFNAKRKLKVRPIVISKGEFGLFYLGTNVFLRDRS